MRRGRQGGTPQAGWEGVQCVACIFCHPHMSVNGNKHNQEQWYKTLI